MLKDYAVKAKPSGSMLIGNYNLVIACFGGKAWKEVSFLSRRSFGAFVLRRSSNTLVLDESNEYRRPMAILLEALVYLSPVHCSLDEAGIPSVLRLNAALAGPTKVSHVEEKPTDSKEVCSITSLG